MSAAQWWYGLAEVAGRFYFARPERATTAALATAMLRGQVVREGAPSMAADALEIRGPHESFAEADLVQWLVQLAPSGAAVHTAALASELNKCAYTPREIIEMIRAALAAGLVELREAGIDSDMARRLLPPDVAPGFASSEVRLRRAVERRPS